MKLPAVLLKLQSKEGFLRVTKSKITGENTFKGDNFEVGGNHEFNKGEKSLFLVLLQICDNCFNPSTAKYIYLRFSSIVSCLPF